MVRRMGVCQLLRSNPVTYCIEVVRMVVLKGSGFNDLKQHFLITAVLQVALNSFAIWNYKKTSLIEWYVRN